MSEQQKLYTVRAAVSDFTEGSLYIPIINDTEALRDANSNGRQLSYQIRHDKPGETTIAQALRENYNFPALSIVRRSVSTDGISRMHFRTSGDMTPHQEPNGMLVNAQDLMHAIDRDPDYYNTGDIEFIKNCFARHFSNRLNA